MGQFTQTVKVADKLSGAFDNLETQSKNLNDFQTSLNLVVAKQSAKHNLVGLSVKDGVPAINQAIDNYVKAINAQIGKMDAEKADASKAFAGSVDEAIELYMRNMKKACQSIITYLYNFQAQLAEVQKAWEAKDKALSSKLGTQGASAKAKFQTFTSGSAK